MAPMPLNGNPGDALKESDCLRGALAIIGNDGDGLIVLPAVHFGLALGKWRELNFLVKKWFGVNHILYLMACQN
ncbi:MAG: hypothetical protein MZV70_56450 [Desulfobacterales bacterium]|nr:hypothetical protein [Desulfobacterales bacterium]